MDEVKVDTQLVIDNLLEHIKQLSLSNAILKSRLDQAIMEKPKPKNPD